ncbi:MAG: response regulator [Endomicrobiales bacterium]|nr:response regulator [Endomicrobiales bacterium]
MLKETSNTSISTPSSKDKVRILVIDDEKGIRNMLSYDLTSRGYDVDVAVDGEEGIEKVKNDNFNIVVTDIKMPKLSGLKVLEAIKKINPHIEIIMTTGFGTIDMAVESMKKGAYDFITKPYNIDELNSRIEKALERQSLSYEIVTLKELNRLKSEFLANTSHELRTPMNAIIGYVTLMSNNVYGDLNKKQEKIVKRIHANASGLMNLINNILDVSKISSGKIKINIENINVNKLLKEIMDMMNILAEEKNLYLKLETDENIILKADKNFFKQIFVNLIGNAIKFTDKGGVTVSSKLIKQENAPSKVLIEVKDTGIGIKPENFNMIFEEFQQVDSSTTRKHGGIGLGLSIVKKLLDLSGGNVRVKSALGKGSIFSVNFSGEIKPLKNQ